MKLEDKIMEKEEAKKIRDKKFQEYEGRIRELTGAIKWNNMHIIVIPEEEERQKGAEGILEQIIAENFPDLEKDTAIQVQEAQRPPFRCNMNQSSARRIIVKLAKYKYTERILKAARHKMSLTYKGRHIKLAADLPTESWQSR